MNEGEEREEDTDQQMAGGVVMVLLLNPARGRSHQPESHRTNNKHSVQYCTNRVSR